MAIQMSENFKLLSKEALDGRISYKSLSEMTSMQDSYLYDGCLATIEGDTNHKTYQWWSNNAVDSTLGKWRELNVGGTAENVSYDNNESGIDSTNVQDAIDETIEKIKDMELFKFPNATIIGTPTINNGQVSNFSSSNYMKFPFIVNMQGRPFEIDIAFTTGNNVTNQQNIIDGIDHGIAFAIRDSKFVLVLGSQSGQWDISNGEKISSVTVNPNTDYRVKISWDGIEYKFKYSIDGETYIEDTNMTVSSSLSLYPTQINIGVTSGLAGIFTGIINMNYCSLTISDKVVWTGMDDVGLATRMAVDMSNIDNAGIKRVEEISKVPVFTKAEWEALSEEEKISYAGKQIIISDDTPPEVVPIIDDESVSSKTTWSSEKITPYIGIHSKDISDILEAGGHIKLSEGEYIISRPVVVPDGSVIEGAGFTTIIRPQISNKSYNLLTIHHNTTIKDCHFTGTGSILVPDVPQADNCIYVTGILNRLENLTIENFEGKAINIYNIENESGAQRIFAAIIDKCYICSCGFGILLDGEYSTVNNCIVRGCVYGCMNVCGNNIMSNSHFDKNVVCLRIASTSPNTGLVYANHGHSSVIGCTFNHGGKLNEENSGWGVYIDHVSVGVVLTGCQWFYALNEILDSRGVLFDSCEFGGGTFKSHNNTGLIMMRGNILHSPVAIETADSYTKFDRNYNFDMTEWKA